MTAATSVTTTNESKTAETTWDLTTTLSPYLDLHMMFPLLEYVDGLISQKLISYTSSEVATARLSLLHPTNMVDYAMDIYKELHDVDDPPAEMEEMKTKIFAELETLREGCKTLDGLCCDENGVRTKLKEAGQWNVEYLASSVEHNVDMKTIETYRLLAKFNYDCGDYSSANKQLECYLSLFANFPQTSQQQQQQQQETQDADAEGKNTTPTPEGNPQMYYLKEISFDLLQGLWGRLSCEILLENWDQSSIALTAVKTALESLVKKNALSPLEALEQRTWLLHWSLFVFWNTTSKKNGLEQLIDLFFSERYLQAITTNTPHLLRYLTAAVLLSKRLSSDNNKRLVKDLIRVMSHCDYKDPIVDFVDCLCIKFNFKLAQEKLTQCEEVLQQDFFLCKQTSLFMEEARIFVFENYCRIHNKIDLDVLSEKLAMETNAAERWIVDLIRSVSLDAKIDAEERCVVMGCGEKNVSELIMEKMKDANVRSGVLVGNMSSLVIETKKRKEKMLAEADDDEY